jgi:hypothetical protein
LTGYPNQAHTRLRHGHLYKFKSLQGANFAHVREIVRDSMIFCPRPDQLNDPDECKPAMVIGDIFDPKYWPKVEAWVRRCVRHRETPPTEEEIQTELSTLTQERLAELVRKANDEYHRAINNRFRILSLADSRTNDHLWQAYADNYAGVCLEFFVDPMLGSAYEVQYSDEFRALDITNDEGFDALMQTALIKRTRWKSEGEYRLVLGEPPIDDDPRLVQQRLQFPEHLLTGIVLGNLVSEDHQAALLNIARFRISPLAFSIASRSEFGEVRIESLRQ